MKYRKKPVVIEAVRWMTDNYEEVSNFVGDVLSGHDDGRSRLKIATLEGEMIADPFDWIIRGIKGEFYSCKPDIFEKTYELFEETQEGEAVNDVEAMIQAGKILFLLVVGTTISVGTALVIGACFYRLFFVVRGKGE